MMQKTDIKGLTLLQLRDFAVKLDEAKYRGDQLFDWLYKHKSETFEHISAFSKTFRDRLGESAEIGAITCVTEQASKHDGTIKYLFALADGKRIESVLIPPRRAATVPEEETRLTICISTQVGCALDCKFCATAAMGIIRNLTTGEIVDQVMQVQKISGRTITNVVFMGMGEPFMNYDNVMDAVEIISTGLKITARRITVSTAGVVPKIRQMADEGRKVKLAISLHTLDDKARTELMPINAKYPLSTLLDAAEYYYKKMKQRITFEYILFDGWNDTNADVARIVKLSGRIPCKVNIIPFHSITFTHPTGLSAQLHPTPARRAAEFVEQLRARHVTVFTRSSAGEDIDAACGQLAILDERGRKVSERVIRH
jgi:23S rRNA (adenine2503-C2)-methyltransferase